MSARLASGGRMTVDEYLQWSQEQPKGRYELVDGVPIKMSPERNVHALVKGLVYLALSDAVRTHGATLVAFVDGPTIPTGKRQAREPDVVVHPREGIDWDALSLEQPVILVEVTSPSTARSDSVDKLSEYFAISSVSHYLIVDPSERTVVHHRRDAAGVPQSEPIDKGMLSLDPPGLVVNVARFFPAFPAAGGI